jgi:hypothetical protein
MNVYMSKFYFSNITKLGESHKSFIAVIFLFFFLLNFERRFITVHKTSPSAMIDLWMKMRREYNCDWLDNFLSFMVYKYDLHLSLSDL